MLKPESLFTVTETGVEVSHEVPIGWVRPATTSLVIFIVMFDVVVTAPVLGSIVPVVGPSLMSLTVAVTGTSPSSLNEPVAGGRVRVAVIAPVLRSAVVRRWPGPSATSPFGVARCVVPVTGYLKVTVVSAEAVPVVASTPATASRPAAAPTMARRGVLILNDLIMRCLLIVDVVVGKDC